MLPSSPDASTSGQAPVRPFPLHLLHLSNYLQPSPETIVLLLAVAIGGGTGMAVVLFHRLIEAVHHLMLEDLMGILAHGRAWPLACVPILGGLIVGLMRWRLQDFGPGLSALIAAPQKMGTVSPIRSTAKTTAAAISLGSGASLGPEGPSVEIGANIGIALGRALNVSQERQRLLLGAGAAAGLAAGFNAPIAGVFFALEVVLGTTFATSAVSVVLLSAVVAALIAQIGLGAQPAFALPSYDVRSPLELPLYLGLGLFACLISIIYIQASQLAKRLFQGEITGFSWMGRIPPILRPVVGGMCIGITALYLPQTLGIGYVTIEAMLRDVQFSLALLLALLVVKLALTALSLGSGFVGGLFAPAMFLGASLGAAYGKILGLLLPAAEIAAPPAYAMVGMAAVLAASARAPLTAILLLFELTRDYRIILPLMAAVGLSVWLLDRLKPISQHLPTVQSTELTQQPDQASELLHQVSVFQAMQPDFLMLPHSMTVVEAGLAMTRHLCRSALVVDETDQPAGIVTLQDINRAIATSEQAAPTATTLRHQTLETISTKNLLYVYDDESLAEAVTRMATQGLHQLPVVSRAEPHQIVGVLEREQIALACSVAATRKALHPYLSPTSNVETLPLPIAKSA